MIYGSLFVFVVASAIRLIKTLIRKIRYCSENLPVSASETGRFLIEKVMLKE